MKTFCFLMDYLERQHVTLLNQIKNLLCLLSLDPKVLFETSFDSFTFYTSAFAKSQFNVCKAFERVALAEQKLEGFHP